MVSRYQHFCRAPIVRELKLISQSCYCTQERSINSNVYHRLPVPGAGDREAEEVLGDAWPGREGRGGRGESGDGDEQEPKHPPPKTEVLLSGEADEKLLFSGMGNERGMKKVDRLAYTRGNEIDTRQNWY